MRMIPALGGWAVPWAAGPPQDANLVRSPSFETEKAAWPDGWMAAQGHAARDAESSRSDRPLRAADGSDNGVRLPDLDHEGGKKRREGDGSRSPAYFDAPRAGGMPRAPRRSFASARSSIQATNPFPAFW
jgi:hypothetical protein